MATSPGVIQGHANLGNSTSQAIDPISYDTDEADFQEGGFDPATDGLPSYTGSLQAPIKAGAEWYATVAGVLSGTPGITGGDEFAVGDTLLALVDNPGSTATNWLRKGTGDSALAAGGGWAEEAAAKTAAEEGASAATFGVGATVGGAPSIRLTDSSATVGLIARLVPAGSSAGLYEMRLRFPQGSGDTFDVSVLDRSSSGAGFPGATLYRGWSVNDSTGVIASTSGTLGTSIANTSELVATGTGTSYWDIVLTAQLPESTSTGHRWICRPRSTPASATGSLDIANLEARYLGPTGGWPEWALHGFSASSAVIAAGDPIEGMPAVKLSDISSGAAKYVIAGAAEVVNGAGVYRVVVEYTVDAGAPYHALVFHDGAPSTSVVPGAGDHVVALHSNAASAASPTAYAVGETLRSTVSQTNGRYIAVVVVQLPDSTVGQWSVAFLPAFAPNTDTFDGTLTTDIAATGDWTIQRFEVRKTGQPFFVRARETNNLQLTGSTSYTLIIDDNENNDPLGYWSGTAFTSDFDGWVEATALFSYSNNAAATTDPVNLAFISDGAASSIVASFDIEALGIGVTRSVAVTGTMAVSSGDAISLQLVGILSGTDIDQDQIEISFICHPY